MSMTQSADFFTGLRDNIVDLGLDIVRAKHIDVERIGDDRNMPDQADLAAGEFAGDAFRPAVAGMTVANWALLGAAVVVGIVVLKKFL